MVLRWFTVAFLGFLVGGQSTSIVCLHIISQYPLLLFDKRIIIEQVLS